MFAIWIQFLVCVALILAAGTVLSRYGDVLAEKTGMGRTWIGLVLLATVTSLPEMFTGISSVSLAFTPDITLGDLFGSCVFNLSIIIVVDFIYRHESVFFGADQGHILSAAMGVGMIGVAGFALLLEQNGSMPSLAHMGLGSIFILFAYPLIVRVLFVFERRRVELGAGSDEEEYGHITLRKAALTYTGAAIVVVVAALRLPFIGERISQEMGWNQSFVGTLFIALATSVPELVVTVTAVRMGALDLAIGNVLGSNLFNIWVIGILDLITPKGPILVEVSANHASTAFSGIMMSGLIIIGLQYRAKHRLGNTVGWISIFLLAIFLINSYVLFRS